MHKTPSPLDADALAERRRLERRMSFWRVAAVVTVLAGLALWLGSTGTLERDHVARVLVDGIIVDDTAQQEILHDIGENDAVKALIVRINTPGGTTVGSEALFAAIRGVAQDKPVIAVMGTSATSGGYIAALATDHIIARRNTVTGSIGVIFQWLQVNELLDKVGVQVHDVKTGPLKAEPNPFGPPSAEVLELTRAAAADSYDWFVGLVVERRGLDEAQVRTLADGRIFTGAQAVEAGLVDAIGGEMEARTWLAENHGISEDLPIADHLREDEGRLWRRLGQAVSAAGLGAIAAALGGDFAVERLRLDGLLSLWQAGA